MPFGLGFFAAAGGLVPFAPFGWGYDGDSRLGGKNVALDADGYCYMRSGNNIVKINPAGVLVKQVTASVTDGAYVGQIYTDSSGNPWVCEGQKITKLDKGLSTQTTYTLSTTGTIHAKGLDFFANGDLCITGYYINTSSVFFGLTMRMQQDGTVVWARSLRGPSSGSTLLNTNLGVVINTGTEDVFVFGNYVSGTTNYVGFARYSSSGTYGTRTTYSSPSLSFSTSSKFETPVVSYLHNGTKHFTWFDDNGSAAKSFKLDSGTATTAALLENSAVLKNGSGYVLLDTSDAGTTGNLYATYLDSDFSTVISGTQITGFSEDAISGWNADSNGTQVFVTLDSLANNSEGVALTITTPQTGTVTIPESTITATSATRATSAGTLTSTAITLTSATITVTATSATTSTTPATTYTYASGQF